MSCKWKSTTNESELLTWYCTLQVPFTSTVLVVALVIPILLIVLSTCTHKLLIVRSAFAGTATKLWCSPSSTSILRRTVLPRPKAIIACTALKHFKYIVLPELMSRRETCAYNHWIAYKHCSSLRMLMITQSTRKYAISTFSTY